MRYSRIGYWGIPAVGLGGLAVCIYVVEHVIAPGRSWLSAGLISVALIGCLALTLMAYRHADEVMLQTHKTAWFWGSLIAVIAVVPAILCVGWRLVAIQLPLPPSMDHPQVYFVIGMQCMLAIECLGFLAALAYQRWLQ